jgi:hypothetical protein
VDINQDLPMEGTYQGRIIDQAYLTPSGDEVRIVLTVCIDARLKNEKVAADGAEECPRLEREVWITFGPTDDWKLERAISDLERLGFDSNDLSLLHPDHPEHVSLVGKEVHVRVRTSGAYDYWNLAWPRLKSQSGDIGTASESAPRYKDRIARTKQRMKEDRAAKKKGANTAGGAERSDLPY